MKLTEQQATTLHSQLAHLLEQMPADLTRGEGPLWLGRVHVIIERADVGADALLFSNMATNLSQSPLLKERERTKLMIVAYRALAKLEASSPPSFGGMFVHPGNVFDAFTAIAKVLGQATIDLLIVDPYADEKILTEFGGSVAPGVPIRILADRNDYKRNLSTAVSRWQQQNGDARPVELRLAVPKRLHDRAIFVDRRDAWTLTQSIKDFAVRSPGHVTRVDNIGSEKREAYETIWEESEVAIAA
ncbi:TPA: hypothetical protein ACKRM8_006098 [Pseudomonas aeruginosa]